MNVQIDSIDSGPGPGISGDGYGGVPQPMEEQVNKPLNRFVIRNSKMLVASLHQIFHYKVSKEVEIDDGQDKRRVFTAPALLPLHPVQGRPDDMAELLRHSVKSISEMLVTKLDDVDEHQQLIFSVVVHHGTDREGEQTKVVPGEWFFQGAQDAFAKLTHARPVVLHQTLEQGFLAGVVSID